MLLTVIKMQVLLKHFPITDYSNFTEQLISIAATTGIVLDLSYTNKAVKGLLNELRVNPTRFKGKRILYIHTGIIIPI